MGKKGEVHSAGKTEKAIAQYSVAGAKGKSMVAPGNNDQPLRENTGRPRFSLTGKTGVNQVSQQKQVSQLKSVNAVAGANKVNADTDVWFSDGKDTIHQYFTAAVNDENSRADLMKSIATKAGTLGAAVDGVVNNNWTFSKANANKPAVDFYDPVMVRVSGKYNAAPNQKNLKLDYHFGNNWHGYVIKVEDEGKGLNDTMTTGAAGANEYSNVHDVDPAPAKALSAEDEADPVTKIAGEGARWVAIRNAASYVRDDSKIYTNQNAANKPTSQVRYVSFPNLWKSWAQTFDKKFNISNDTVAEKLKAANIVINAMGGPANVPVGTTASNNMTHNRDISVDNPAPANQLELAVVNMGFEFYKKTAKVAESNKSLDQEKTAFKGEVNGSGLTVEHNSFGYVGGDLFVALCTVPGGAAAADTATFKYKAAKHEAIAYPKYRETKMDTLLPQTDSAALFANEDETYQQEKADLYEHRIAELIQVVVDTLALGEEPVVVDQNRLREYIEETYPWGDNADAEVPLDPANWDDILDAEGYPEGYPDWLKQQ